MLSFSPCGVPFLLRRHREPLALLLLCAVCLYLLCARYPFLSLPDTQPSLLVSFGDGRLGNQMSSLATLFGLRERYGLDPLVTLAQARLLFHYFTLGGEHGVGILEQRYPDWEMYRWIVPFNLLNARLKNYDYHALETNPQLCFGRAIKAGRYPNEVALFKEMLPQLRELFVFRRKFREHAEETYRKAAGKRKNVTFISVHIRRSDYKYHLSDLYNLEFVERSYFVRATDFFRRKFKNPLFLFVSDDLSWVRRNFSSGGDVCRQDCNFVGSLPNDVEDSYKIKFTARDEIGMDLSVLSHANHSILTYGTFGMWGALLAGGETVLPKGYDDMKEMKEIRAANMTKWTFM